MRYAFYNFGSEVQAPHFPDLEQGDLAAKGGWQIAGRVDLSNVWKVKTASQRFQMKIAVGDPRSLKLIRGLTNIQIMLVRPLEPLAEVAVTTFEKSSVRAIEGSEAEDQKIVLETTRSSKIT